MSEPSRRQFRHRQVVAGQYRIQGFLGEGGMGEVYRAEDLSVNRFVALKALQPEKLSERAFRSRMRSEVRLGGKVSHPNVCRLFDLYEDREHFFLTMELIRGESLHQILERSVGRLAEEEKLRIAVDLCAGVGAIHRRDILHRDLKPKNVLIDRDGRTVITDFGLADDSAAVFDPSAGTPSYSAPEQLTGGHCSKRSDLYALGVILFELFSGKHPFAGADSLERLLELQQEGPSFDTGAGESVGAAQEAICKCLEIDPDRRPETAEDVATLLIGKAKDPFLHPDTPTPVYRLLLVPEGGLRMRTASSLLAAGLLGLAAVVCLSPLTQPTQSALAGEAPVALEARARRLVGRVGLDPRPRDRRFGYAPGMEGEVRFWYRQSPRLLHPARAGSAFSRPADPPSTVEGMTRVDLEPGGRLLRLAAVPVAGEGAGAMAGPDWEPLFEAAGFDRARLVEVAPSRAPPVFADRLWAWEASSLGAAASTTRVEAASLRGLPVDFRVSGAGGPTAEVDRDPEEAPVLTSPVGAVLFSLGFVAVMLAVVLIAWRNIRRRVADRHAAFRLALLVLLARIGVGVFGAPHVWSLAEVSLVRAVLARSVLSAALVWVLYIALEPLARQSFPQRIASWIRLLHGRVRDPLVGRDLLWGGSLAIAALLWARLFVLAAQRWSTGGATPERHGSLVWIFGQRPADLQLEALAGLRRALSIELFALVHGLLIAFFLIAGVLLLRYLARRISRRPADGSVVILAVRAAALALLVVLCYPASGNPTLDLVAASGAGLLWLVALVRFGVLTSVSATALAWLASSHPLSPSPPGWAATGSWLPVLLMAALLIWASLVACGRAPVWRRRLEKRDPLLFGPSR